MRYRLAIFETHPIQYKVPWFRALAARPEIDLTVFYCLIPDAKEQGRGFGVQFKWDLPLLEGYRYVVLENVARNPGLGRFSGCDTPSIADYLGGRRCVASASVDSAPVEESARRDGARLPHSDLRSPTSDLRPPTFGFQAVIINGWVVKACLQALWACRRAGIPAILRCEACDLQPRAWWKTLAHRALLRQFSAFMAIGAANRRFYLRRGVRPERIVDGIYCVENQRFESASQEGREGREERRRKWGIPQEAVCFLLCGKFEPKKRPMDVLQALAALGRDHGPWTTDHGPLAPDHGPRTTDHRPPVHLLMAGDGELRAECEAYAREHGLPVTFAGFLNQSEVPQAYAVADCLVLPSDHGETWGLVVNEAMASGLPAIVSDRVGCHPDLVVPGETGFVFPCGDVPALAALIRQLAAAPDALRAQGRKAREHVRRYAIGGLVEGTLAALRLVCGR